MKERLTHLVHLIAIYALVFSTDLSPVLVGAQPLSARATVQQSGSALPGLSPQPSTAGWSSSIRGKLLSPSDQPENFLVQLLQTNGTVLREALTSSGGRYFFAHLLPGRYGLRVLAPNDRPVVLMTDSEIDLEPDDTNATIEHDLILADPSVAGQPGLSPSATQAAGRITGAITASDTGLLIPYDEVDVYALDGTFQTYADTFSGVYTVTGLLPGTYKLLFNSGIDPYASEWYSDQTTFSSATPVTVSSGATLTGINAVLKPGGHIKGKITATEGGTPLEGARVAIFDKDGYNYASGIADPSGNYTTTPALRSGDYRVKFRPSSGTSSLYLPKYYNNKPDSTTADAVTVVSPNTVTGISASLDRGARITGQITGADTSLPLSGAYVNVFDCGGQLVSGGLSDAAGIYTTTTALATGGYRLLVNGTGQYLSRYYNAKPDLASADVVNVTAPNLVSGIDVALPPGGGGQIAGHVTTADGGVPLVNARITLYDSNNQVVSLISANASGAYTFTGLLTGNYRLLFRAPTTSPYVQEYYNNKADLVSADVISVTSPNLVSGIDAALDHGGQVSGRITAADSGLPLPSSVSVYNDAGQAVASASVTSSGIYTTTGLLTGTYRVLFAPSVSGEAFEYARQYYNNKPNLAAADLVAVSAPDVVSGIDAQLVSGGRVSGRVIAIDGKPVSGLSIAVFASDGRFVALGSTTTLGTYVTSGISTGSYKVQFDPSILSTVPSRCLGAYVGQYYNNKPDFASADFVSVTAPNTTSTVDAILAIGGINKRLFLPGSAPLNRGRGIGG